MIDYNKPNGDNGKTRKIMEDLLNTKKGKDKNGNGDFTTTDVKKFFKSTAPISKFVFVYGGSKHLKKEFILADMLDIDRQLEDVTVFLFDCSLHGRLSKLVWVKKEWDSGNSNDEFVEIRISEAKTSLRETNIDADMIQLVVSGMSMLARQSVSIRNVKYAETFYPTVIGEIYTKNGVVKFDFNDDAFPLCVDTKYCLSSVLRDYMDTHYISDYDKTTIYLKPIEDWLVEHNITNRVISDVEEILECHPTDDCLFTDDLGMP